MYNLNGNFIELSEVYAVEQYDADSETYPYGLRLRLKNGQSYGVIYQAKKARDDEAYEIVYEIDRQRANEYQAANDTIRYIVRHEMELARRDIRDLKKIVKATEAGK